MSVRPVLARLAALSLGLCFPLATLAAAPGTTLALTYGSAHGAPIHQTGSNWATLGTLNLPGSEFFSGQISGGSSPGNVAGYAYFSDAFAFSLPDPDRLGGGATGLPYRLDALAGSFGAGSLPLTVSLYQDGRLLGMSYGSPLRVMLDFSHGDSFVLAVGGGLRDGSAGLNYAGRFNVAAVPEPSSAILLLVGGVVMGALLRRRRRV